MVRGVTKPDPCGGSKKKKILCRINSDETMGVANNNSPPTSTMFEAVADDNVAINLSMDSVKRLKKEENIVRLCAKMRLKKQRMMDLERRLSLEDSPLHRLAEAAENRKQEEELMETAEANRVYTPSGTPEILLKYQMSSSSSTTAGSVHSEPQSQNIVTLYAAPPQQDQQKQGLNMTLPSHSVQLATSIKNIIAQPKNDNGPSNVQVPSSRSNAKKPNDIGVVARQQLINRPCPICGDKISGFHYGIFSCESCKGSSSSISLNDTCILVQKRVSPSNIEPSGCLKWPNRFPSR